MACHPAGAINTSVTLTAEHRGDDNIINKSKPTNTANYLHDKDITQ